MGLSEALSDDGALTGRGGAVTRGLITGVATFVGGSLHALPFLIPDVQHGARGRLPGRRRRAARDRVDPQALPARVVPRRRWSR